MKQDTKTKNENIQSISDLNSEMNSVISIEQESQREFVRFEFSTPLTIFPLKNCSGEFQLGHDQSGLNGSLLNLSEGGLLIEMDKSPSEGDIVHMSMEIENVVKISHILAKVKRVENDSDIILVGVEFVSKENLLDDLSQAELELMGDDYHSFRDIIRNVVEKFSAKENNKG